jgi:hypothetical protein
VEQISTTRAMIALRRVTTELLVMTDPSASPRVSSPARHQLAANRAVTQTYCEARHTSPRREKRAGKAAAMVEAIAPSQTTIAAMIVARRVGTAAAINPLGRAMRLRVLATNHPSIATRRASQTMSLKASLSGKEAFAK